MIEPWGLRLNLQWKRTNYRQQHLVWIGPEISVGRIQKAQGWPKFQCSIKKSVTRGGLLFIGERVAETAAIRAPLRGRTRRILNEDVRQLRPHRRRPDRAQPGCQKSVPGQQSLPGNRQDLGGLDRKSTRLNSSHL